ncbi:vascular cell adhesion protein 1 isoform X12 [Osmerus eperlanus]|uniref:vascular cell adhesion protein 1 isoform X12 n=1 Tax=Osmerus eperlanus TaxID=29151 RepID=UPI002E0F7E73
MFALFSHISNPSLCDLPNFLLKMERVILGFMMVHSITASAFTLDFSPLNPVARAGDRFVLECRATGCAAAVSFSWRSLKDLPLNSKIENNGSVSRQIFDPVQIDLKSTTVACLATCGDKILSKRPSQKTTKVIVYSLEQPEISGTGDMVVGQESVFTCTVPKVFPSNVLTVQWLLNDRVVKEEEFSTSKALSLEEIQSQYAHTPRQEEQGRALTCKATLNLTLDLPKDRRSRETSVVMAMRSTPEPTTTPEPTATPEPTTTQAPSPW